MKLRTSADQQVLVILVRLSDIEIKLSIGRPLSEFTLQPCSDLTVVPNLVFAVVSLPLGLGSSPMSHTEIRYHKLPVYYCKNTPSSVTILRWLVRQEMANP